MSITNETRVLNISGMFQYFLIFDQPNKSNFQTRKSIFKNNHGKNPEKFNSNNETDLKSTKKKVQFNPKIAVHKMQTWKFAYTHARIDEWQQFGRDRAIFKRKIENLSEINSPILLKKLKTTGRIPCPKLGKKKK